MKPTMMKTHTTKPLYELSREEHGAAIDIGGVPHNIRRRADGFSLQCPRGDGDDQPGCLTGRASSAALSPDAQVTVTETREMTTDDLQVGDTWVYANEGSTGDWFNVMVVEEEYVQVQPCQPTKRYSLSQTRDPVTLVDVEFEAEPVDEERTIMLDSWTGPFELQGCKGERIGHNSCHGLVNVKWMDAGGGLSEECQLLPGGLTVTVREPATYDSPDDVSVGDVVVDPEGFASGIVTRIIDGHAHLITGSGHETRMLPGDLRPARLTSVTWAPREEVTR